MPSAISDELWAELGPRVARAKRSKAGAPPGIPDRQFLEALVYLADVRPKVEEVQRGQRW